MSKNQNNQIHCIFALFARELRYIRTFHKDFVNWFNHVLYTIYIGLLKFNMLQKITFQEN